MTARDSADQFLLEPVGPRMTVVVLGSASSDLIESCARATGTAGLVVEIAPTLHRAGGPAARIRAALLATPVLSHAADLVLVPDVEPALDPDALAEELRRLLAPRGAVRLVAAGVTAGRLVSALAGARFKGISRSPAGIAARGPK